MRDGARSRGWETARSASFPARVSARLRAPSDIRQLRVLSHESKIASSARVSVVCVDKETGGVVVKRLGTLRFDSNAESGYRARELKTVHVNVKDATEVRLEFPGCHENSRNDGRQVGLMALTIVGEPSVGFERGREVNGEQAPLLGRRVVNPLDVDTEVDAVTAEKIREVSMRKERAVNAEDYDEAKRLRDVINKLREFGVKVKVLQEEKLRAVDAEDYDEAKRLKIEIDKMRSSGYEEVFVVPSPRPLSARAPSPSAPTVEEAVVLPPSTSTATARPSFSFDDVPIRSNYADTMRAMAKDAHVSSAGRDGAPDSLERVASNASSTPSVPRSRPQPLDISKSNDSVIDVSVAGMSNDEVPAKAIGRRVPPELEAEAAAFFEEEEGEKAAIVQAEKDKDKEDHELPSPTPLSPSEQVNAAPIIAAFGEEVIVRLYGQAWVHRESALQDINAQLINAWESPESSVLFESDPRETFHSLCKTLGDRLFNDKVANVTGAAAITLASAAKAFAQRVSARDVRDAVGDSISLLVDKLGDTNPRLRESIREAMHAFASDSPGGVSILAHALCKPVQKLSVWRVLTGRLTLLVELIPTYGLDAPEKENSFALEQVMKFATKCFDSANGEARSMAVKVVLACVDIVGNRVRRYLPRTIKSAIRDVIENAIDENEDPYDLRGRSQSKSPKAHVAAYMTPSATPKSPPRHADQGMDWNEPSPSPRDDVPPELAANATMLEREITRRIEMHGEMHAEVAAAMNDLATLYSENENFARAQALFERALAIQESTLGVEHPETVQTLTDLAICHLDREDNRVGRPLLQRALELQQNILGPEHPDVVAIRDVLASLIDDED